MIRIINEQKEDLMFIGIKGRNLNKQYFNDRMNSSSFPDIPSPQLSKETNTIQL